MSPKNWPGYDDGSYRYEPRAQAPRYGPPQQHPNYYRHPQYPTHQLTQFPDYHQPPQYQAPPPVAPDNRRKPYDPADYGGMPEWVRGLIITILIVALALIVLSAFLSSR